MLRNDLKTKAMEDNTKLVESLLEKGADYGTITFELLKLKTLDKASDAISSILPHSIVLYLIASFLLFFSVGLAFWLSELLGNTFVGFFIVGAFYALIGIVVHFFFHKKLKNRIGDYLIKQVLK